jgi:hypothetical protein
VKLLEALNYQGERDLFKVPAGFVTDFASVPGLFTWLVPRYGRFTKAAILHDFLCDEAKEGRFIRSQADGIFRRVMRELGVGFIRRWVMWAAVRLGSGWGVFQPSLWQSCSSSSSRRPRRRSGLPRRWLSWWRLPSSGSSSCCSSWA